MRTAEYVTRTLGGVRGALRQLLAEPSTRLIMVGLDGATIRSVIGSDTLYTIVYVVALVLFAASGYMIYRLLARVKKLDKNTIR